MTTTLDRPEAARPPRRTGITLALEPGRYVWCGCGRSTSEPFCEDPHGVTPCARLAFCVTEPALRKLCTCKQTAHPPYCDGTHHRL